MSTKAMHFFQQNTIAFLKNPNKVETYILLPSTPERTKKIISKASQYNRAIIKNHRTAPQSDKPSLPNQVKNYEH